MSKDINIHNLIAGLLKFKYDVIVDKGFSKEQIALLDEDVATGLLRTGTAHDNPEGLGSERRYWVLNDFKAPIIVEALHRNKPLNKNK